MTAKCKKNASLGLILDHKGLAGERAGSVLGGVLGAGWERAGSWLGSVLGAGWGGLAGIDPLSIS